MTVQSDVISSVPIQLEALDDFGDPVLLHAAHGGLRVAADLPVDGTDYIFTYLTDPDGVADLAVNGSVTAVEYSFSPPVMAHINRVNLGMSDDSKAMPNGFFTIGTLANGLTIQLRDTNGKVLQHFGTDVVPITTHARFGPLAGVDTGTDDTAGTANGAVRWTIAEAGKALMMKPSETLVITVQDDLSAITELFVMVQGVKLDQM